MSQYHFFAKKESEILHITMGWDKPLQGFFLVIEKDSDKDSPFWSNLYQEISHPVSLTPFLKVLRENNLILPSQMLIEIITDKMNNIGNKNIVYVVANKEYTRIEEENLSVGLSVDLKTLYDVYGSY